MGIPGSRITTIYNGIDPEWFAQEVDLAKTRETYGLSGAFTLLEVARLEEGKGHKYLFEAVSLINRAEGDIKLLVVGEGSKEVELKQLASTLGIEDRVVFTGALTDVRPVFAVSDVVVLPSLEEAMGIVLLEGMCMGKPCIASNTGGIPEVVSDGKSGILVEPRDINGLKEAIVKLLKSPDLRTKMGQEGKRIVCEKFHVANMAKQVEDLYISL